MTKKGDLKIMYEMLQQFDTDFIWIKREKFCPLGKHGHIFKKELIKVEKTFTSARNP